MELPSSEAIAFEWSMALMRRAFTDLAASFAAVDPKLADKAIQRIEMMVAGEMDQLLKTPHKETTAPQLRAAIAEAVGPFREMTQEARALVQQGGKPKN